MHGQWYSNYQLLGAEDSGKDEVTSLSRQLRGDLRKLDIYFKIRIINCSLNFNSIAVSFSIFVLSMQLHFHLNATESPMI